MWEVLSADSDLYSYEANILIPVPHRLHPVFPEGVLEEIRDDAVRIFKAVDGYGLSRVDFSWKRIPMKLFLMRSIRCPDLPGSACIPCFGRTKALIRAALLTPDQQAFERYGA